MSQQFVVDTASARVYMKKVPRCLTPQPMADNVTKPVPGLKSVTLLIVGGGLMLLFDIFLSRRSGHPLWLKTTGGHQGASMPSRDPIAPNSSMQPLRPWRQVTISRMVRHQSTSTSAFAGHNYAGRGNGSSGGDNLHLFVGVLSAAKNKERRDAARETWGSDARLARVVFVLARPTSDALLTSIREEAAMHGDIIFVGHVIEHYHNITHQTSEILRAAHAYHAPLTHVVKTDDDSYVHVGRLLDALSSLPRQHTFMGNINQDYMPNRDPKGQWYVSEDVWPIDHPGFPWANGAGFVLTNDLIEPLTMGGAVGIWCNISRPLLVLEDVAMGLWLYCMQQQRNISITYKNLIVSLAKCEPNVHAVFSHYQSPAQLRCLHAKGGQCCNELQWGWLLWSG